MGTSCVCNHYLSDRQMFFIGEESSVIGPKNKQEQQRNPSIMMMSGILNLVMIFLALLNEDLPAKFGQ